MDYIVWKQEPYGETWQRFDCEGDAQLQKLILSLIMQQGEVLVTVPVNFDIKVSVAKVPSEVVPAKIEKPAAKKPVKEVKTEDATPESKPEADQGSGDQSPSSV